MISLDIPRDLVTEEMLIVVRKGWVMGYGIGIGRPIMHFFVGFRNIMQEVVENLEMSMTPWS